jgi:hypothetical protein
MFTAGNPAIQTLIPFLDPSQRIMTTLCFMLASTAFLSILGISCFFKRGKHLSFWMVSILVTDGILNFAIALTSFLALSNQGWGLGRGGCIATSCLVTSCLIATMLSLLGLAYERLCVLRNYHFTNFRLLLRLVWAISLLLGLWPLYTHSYGYAIGLTPLYFSCSIQFSSREVSVLSFTTVYTIVYVLSLSFTIMVHIVTRKRLYSKEKANEQLHKVSDLLSQLSSTTSDHSHPVLPHVPSTEIQIASTRPLPSRNDLSDLRKSRELALEAQIHSERQRERKMWITTLYTTILYILGWSLSGLVPMYEICSGKEAPIDIYGLSIWSISITTILNSWLVFRVTQQL